MNLGAPAEAGWTMPITDRDLDRCAQSGFTAVRLSIASQSSPTDTLGPTPWSSTGSPAS